MESDEVNNVIRCEAIEQRSGIGPHELLKGCGMPNYFSFLFSFLAYV